MYPHHGATRGEGHHQDDEGHGAGKRILLEQVAQQGVDHHGTRGAPAACNMRQARSSGRSPPWRSPTEATANIVRPARITGFLPKLSASGP